MLTLIHSRGLTLIEGRLYLPFVIEMFIKYILPYLGEDCYKGIDSMHGITEMATCEGICHA